MTLRQPRLLLACLLTVWTGIILACAAPSDTHSEQVRSQAGKNNKENLTRLEDAIRRDATGNSLVVTVQVKGVDATLTVKGKSFLALPSAEREAWVKKVYQSWASIACPNDRDLAMLEIEDENHDRLELVLHP